MTYTNLQLLLNPALDNLGLRVNWSNEFCGTLDLFGVEAVFSAVDDIFTLKCYVGAPPLEHTARLELWQRMLILNEHHCGMSGSSLAYDPKAMLICYQFCWPLTALDVTGMENLLLNFAGQLGHVYRQIFAEETTPENLRHNFDMLMV